MRRKSLTAVLVHVIRVAVVVALLALLPSPRRQPAGDATGSLPPDLALVQSVLPTAVGVETSAGDDAMWEVRDASGETIARAARTLPAAEAVVGYRGPTEALVLIDENDQLIGVRLIDSVDTEEHVAEVQEDEAFFEQFRTWTWNGPPAGASIDGVSGATLTSLALAEGVLKRIGGDMPSLVFPDGVTVEEVSGWFPAAAEVAKDGDLSVVLDGEGNALGNVIRTGPLEDGVIGYQGPTELLIKLDPAGELVEDIKLRSSFDNQPYVRYCKTEYSFWPLFEGQTISQLAAMDLEAAGVEGVSGATMTSMAIAKTLVSASQTFQQRAEARAEASRRTARTFWQRLRAGGLREAGIRWTAADVGCVLILLGVPLFRRLGWFRNRVARGAWLVIVVAVIGLWSGNLISMALIAGWSSEGVAWRLAPVLAAVVAVAFVGPVTAKSNPYCNHLCPHGAVQQLIRPQRRAKRHWAMPQRFARVVSWLPGSLLVFAYLTLQFNGSADLSSWEPFHAYLIRIAPWTAMAFAIATLVFAAMVPMGYCRYGCPTGRLLDHLRRSSASGRVRLADGVALVLLAVAVTRQFFV
jgi:Na+-translocating ferredoxin:NAD+ oxidoreductase RnfG subunit